MISTHTKQTANDTMAINEAITSAHFEGGHFSELLAAIQPLIDASLRHKELATYIPRIQQAANAMQKPCHLTNGGGGRATSSKMIAAMANLAMSGGSISEAARRSGVSRAALSLAISRQTKAAAQK